MVSKIEVATWGVELEGGWDESPPDVARMKGDGSVTAQGRYRGGAEMASPVFSSEAPSPEDVERRIAEETTRLRSELGNCGCIDCSHIRENRLSSIRQRNQDWESWVKTNYPQHVNSSCGMHVHLGFDDNCKEQAVSLLFDHDRYMRFLLDSLKKWGRKARVRNETFYTRLRGANEYCKMEWTNNIYTSERYRIVNFAAWNKFNTVEIRVLPMFKSKELAVKAVKKVIGLTNTYLKRACKKPDVKLTARVVI